MQYYEPQQFQFDCPFQNIGKCTRYPITKISYSDGNNDFFVELYIYNKIGISTRIQSRSFSLPSKLPPGHLVIIDVDPEINSSSDIDFQTSNTSLCFLLKQFAHNQSVSIFAGVGLSPNSTDVIPYTTIHNSRHCFRNIQMTPFTKYYSVVRANSSGGVSYAASNGVIAIDIDALAEDLKLKNGKRECHEKNKVTPKINVHNNQSILSYANLSVLEEFTMFIKKDANKTSNKNNEVVNVNGFEIYDILQTDLHQVMKMVASSNNGEIIFKSEITSSNEINLHRCQFNQPYLLSESEISFAWTDVERNDYRPTHFEISIVAFAENNIKVIQSTTTHEKTATFRNITLSPGDEYFGVVKACFSRICSKPMFGPALEMFPRDSKMIITAKLSKQDEGIYKIGIEILHTHHPLKHSLIRWTLAMDSQGRKRNIDWNYCKIQNESMVSISLARVHEVELSIKSEKIMCFSKITIKQDK